MNPSYTYRAVVRSIYDGDTMRVDIDLGCNVWLKNESIRVMGIDAPELRGVEREAGLQSRDWLRGQLPTGTPITIRTHLDKRGKYGRLVAEIFLDGVNIGQAMINAAMASKYE